MMAGLEAFDDPGRLLMCLHELNHLLLRGAEGLNLGRILGAVTQILSRMQGNSQIAVLACRALNNLIDLEPGITSNIAGDGVALPVLCQKLVHLTDMDVAEQCIKWYSSTSKHTTTTIHHHQSLSPTPCLCNVCVCVTAFVVLDLTTLVRCCKLVASLESWLTFPFFQSQFRFGTRADGFVCLLVCAFLCAGPRPLCTHSITMTMFVCVYD